MKPAASPSVRVQNGTTRGCLGVIVGLYSAALINVVRSRHRSRRRQLHVSPA